MSQSFVEDEYLRTKAKLRELELEHQSLCEDHTALLAEYREQRDRADSAEAKLRELVKAAEWRALRKMPPLVPE